MVGESTCPKMGLCLREAHPHNISSWCWKYYVGVLQAIKILKERRAGP